MASARWWEAATGESVVVNRHSRRAHGAGSLIGT